MKTFLAIVPPQVTLYGQAARPQPPMGLAYALNGVVNAGWEPVLLDSCAEGYETFNEDKQREIRVTGLPTRNILVRIGEIQPDMIGVSFGLSTDHDYAKIIVRNIKKAYPQVPIVLGGSHASLMHRELLEGSPIERVDADFVITGRDLGSGESSVEELLKAYVSDKKYENVSGIVFRRDGEIITTPPVRVTKEALHHLALPRRDLFATRDETDIYSIINQSHTGPVDETPYAVVHTSRGCGGCCTFCHQVYGDFDPTLISRSLENITEELDHLKELGVKTISIEDDNFGGFKPSRTELAVQILREIQARGFRGVYFPNGITFRSMNNLDHVLLRQLRQMADNGIKVRNSLPVESGDPDTLKRIIKKPHNLKDVEAVLGELEKDYFNHPNMEFDAFFMMGVVGYNSTNNMFVSESLESIERTFTLARRVSDLGILVNVWWMKPNPNGPHYRLWREKFPEKPFYELQFSFHSGIWGPKDQEMALNDRIKQFNKEMNKKGAGSKRPIYPVESKS